MRTMILSECCPEERNVSRAKLAQTVYDRRDQSSETVCLSVYERRSAARLSVVFDWEGENIYNAVRCLLNSSFNLTFSNI